MRKKGMNDDRAVSMMVSIVSIVTVIAVLELIIYVGAMSVFGGGVTVPTGKIDLEVSTGESEIIVSIESLSIATEFTDLEVVICDASGRELAEGFEVQMSHVDVDHDGLATVGDMFTISRDGSSFVEHAVYSVYLIYTPTGDEVDTASVTI